MITTSQTKKKLLLSALGMLALCLAPYSLIAQEHKVESYRANGVHITEGWISAETWSDKARKILADYSKYRQWGLRYMDGKDQHSAKFWAHFTDFDYKSPDYMHVIFDLKLGFPFGAKDAKAIFKIDHQRESQGIFRFVLERPPIGINNALLDLRVKKGSQGRADQLVFRLEIKFWSAIEAMMDFKIFDRDMIWRVQRMQENLRDYVEGKL